MRASLLVVAMILISSFADGKDAASLVLKWEGAEVTLNAPGAKADWTLTPGKPLATGDGIVYTATQPGAGVEVRLTQYDDLPRDPQIVLMQALTPYKIPAKGLKEWETKTQGNETEVELRFASGDGTDGGKTRHVTAKSWIFDNTNFVAIVLTDPSRGDKDEASIKTLLELTEIPGKGK